MTTLFDIVVYGGAFNPPHAGHADVIRHLSSHGKRIIIVPSFFHAHGKVMAPFDLRVAWLERIAREIGGDDVNIEVDRCEEVIALTKPGQPIYTWDVLHHVHAREGIEKQKIAFVMGEDNVPVFDTFYRADELKKSFGIVVAREKVVLHSTQLRQILAQGDKINPQWMPPGLFQDDLKHYKQAPRP